MNDFNDFDKNKEILMRLAEEESRRKELEKQNLTISKKIFRIAKITLVVAIASGIISLIALFKN